MNMQMEPKYTMIGILMSIITLINIICGVAAELESSTSREKHLDGARKTNQYSKRHDEVKTIQSEDGDIIDCIDIYKQPAFDHPALRNHTIQMSPTNGPRMEKTSTKTETTSRKNKEGSGVTATSQLWQRSGSCPKGTIPMLRRIPNKDLLNKANCTVHAYGRNMPYKHHVMQSNDGINFMPNHSVAGVLTEGYSYSGGKANIKVWTPDVESEDEYSTSHASIQNGPENAQSGWAVNPSVYKDHQTLYYVYYWTADDSKKTGCFDLTCPGFVQASHEIALGRAIYPISSPTGLPFEIIVHVYKDPVTGNWWVQFGVSINIGYWSAELFKLLKYHAVFVWWGGEVYSSKVRTHPHTATDMGSGRWPDWIFQTSGTITKMRDEQDFHDLKIPDWVNAHSDEYECYDVFYVSDLY